MKIFKYSINIFDKFKTGDAAKNTADIVPLRVEKTDPSQDVYENSKSISFRSRTFLFIKSRYAVLYLVFLVFGVFIVFNTALLQLDPAAGTEIGQSTAGIARERVVAAPRGNIYDRYGVPLAVSKNINVLYICNANLENEKFNSMILDLAVYLESNQIKYSDSISDYITINPLKFVKNKDAITEWQANKNIFDLDATDDSDSIKFDDDKHVKTDVKQFFDYLRFTLFKIDKKYSIEDAFRIIRIRYQIYTNYWAFKNGTPVEIARDVDDSAVTKIEEQNYRFTGILSGVESERRYLPDAKYVGHVMGYVGAISSKQYDELQSAGYSINDITGKAGVELFAERYLKGTNGLRPYNILTAQNENETYLSEDLGTAPIAGNDIMLTIDMKLQKIAMESLAKNILFIKNNPKDKNKGDADSGAVVMLDVKTGETLVMASYPSFDPNDFIMSQYDVESRKRMKADLLNTKDKPMLNRAIMEIYAPGSTFKPIVAVSALEEGISTNIHCGGTEMIVEWKFRCLEYPRRGHGDLTLARGMATSCNIFFHKLGVAVGIEKLNKWMKTFGLGEYTGIDLPGEEKGNRSYKDVKKLLYQNQADQTWFPADTAQTAIGQFLNRYTVIQLARYVTALSNGTLVTPHVIKEITKSDGTILKTGANEPVKIKLKSDTIGLIKNALLQVSQTNEGTASKVFKSFPIKVACKTGTAETGNEDRSSSDALFICYAPADNPQVAIAQIIEKGVWGSNTMGVAKDLLTAYFGIKVPLQFEVVDMPGVG
ncbi:MAG: penicillin-binding transpeptidase domain-containing protein [Saccharofermentanales bacterium]